jgi:tripartite-type tricarboxylate transporter receptor subunit TctC
MTRLFFLMIFAFLAWPSTATAQRYPDRSIRLVVSFPTGAPYVLALLMADKLREPLGQTMVPDFRSGAGGNVASEVVAKAAPDGYTLLLQSPSIAISPSMIPNLTFDTFRDFTPITLLATVPNILVVHPSVPANSLKELVALAQAQPGKLNYGSGGLGSGSQLGTELFKTLNKLNMVHVPYKGAAIAMNAMMSGEVDLVTSTVPATIPLINAGRIRGLAVLAPERVKSLPQVRTTAEEGMPEVVVITWYGLFAPAGVKHDIVERLNQEIVKMMNLPDIKAKLAQVEVEPTTSTPAEFEKFVRAEYEKWGRVIREAHIQVKQ